jgi:xanthosine utilization system XapX-like protein
MSTAATPVPEAPASMSTLGRFVGVFFSPKETFASIAQRPTWIAPLILLSIIGLTVIWVFAQRVGWRSYIERQIEQNPSAQKRMERVPADQRDGVIQQQAKFWGWFSYVIPIAGTFLGAVIVGAVLLGAFSLVSGTKVGFVRSLSIVSWAWVPLAIHGLLGLLIMFLKDPATIDIKNLVASNPGALLPDDAAKWLSSLLTSLDIFTFWVMALMAMGYSATNPRKISFGNAFSTVVGVWLIWVLLSVGAAAAFS